MTYWNLPTIGEAGLVLRDFKRHKVDGTLGPIEHACLEDAEAWIAERESVDPEGVRGGDYYIDAIGEEARG